MTDSVELRYIADSQPSLCIPRVFNNITEPRIHKVFNELGLGKISRIDIKERKSEKGESYKRVYVHFDKWFWNEDAQAARKKLLSGKEIKIVYDNPWFWKVSASKWSPRNEHQEMGAPAPQRSRAHIEFDDEPVRSEPVRRKPTTERRGRFEHRLPIAPTLTRKAPKLDSELTKTPDKKPIMPRSPSSSPPPSCRPLKHEEKRTQGGVILDYGTVVPPKRAKKQEVRKLEEDNLATLEANPTAIAVEEEIKISLSEEDRQLCDDMYGDL